MDLNRWLAETQLVVCVGSGGVGKTTTSAAIGLWAAASGRKAMVGEPIQVDLEALPDASGELWAMMLDSRSTMDALIAAIAPDADARDRILANHVYRHMADTFAGSQDYMATEKLFDLVQSGRYDLVVLDTPPVKNALDFLESPGRVVNFLDERVLSWFLSPRDSGGLSRRFMVSTSAVVYRLLGVVFGQDFLEDLFDFFQDFQGLYEGFRGRHARVVEMLRQPSTAFVTVCAPTESSLDVAVFFQEELRERALPRGGVIVNQVHFCEGEGDDAKVALRAPARELAGELPPRVVASVLARLGRAHKRLRALSLAEQAMTRKVAAAAGGGFYQQIPRLAGEVHDLSSLFAVGRHLFDRPARWRPKPSETNRDQPPPTGRLRGQGGLVRPQVESPGWTTSPATSSRSAFRTRCEARTSTTRCRSSSGARSRTSGTV